MKKLIVAMGVSIFLLVGAFAHAAPSLIEWDLTGQPGDEAEVAASFSAPNISGYALKRGHGLTPVTRVGTLNSADWTGDLTDYVGFGFKVAPGYKVDISELYIGTCSSGTGPAQMGLYVSFDGYLVPVAYFVQEPGNNLVYTNKTFTSYLSNRTGDIYFRLYQIGSKAANGGYTDAQGTFMVTNYNLDGEDTGPFRLTGSVKPVKPIPITGASWLLLFEE